MIIFFPMTFYSLQTSPITIYFNSIFFFIPPYHSRSCPKARYIWSKSRATPLTHQVNLDTSCRDMPGSTELCWMKCSVVKSQKKRQRRSATKLEEMVMTPYRAFLLKDCTHSSTDDAASCATRGGGLVSSSRTSRHLSQGLKVGPPRPYVG